MMISKPLPLKSLLFQAPKYDIYANFREFRLRLISFFPLSLPKALEDGSSSSSGSSSGYGSQNAVKIEEKNPGKKPFFVLFFACWFFYLSYLYFVCVHFSLGFTTSTSTPSSRIDNYCTYRHYNSPPVFSKLRPSHFTLQSPSVSLRHQHTPPIVENIISDHYCHRNRTLRRSDSYSPGLYPNTVKKNPTRSKSNLFSTKWCP